MPELRLSARGVARSFGDGAGVNGIDLDVEAGEIHALVGLNGAGKSTLMRLLLGMLRPDAGTVFLLGYRLPDIPSAVWSRVGHLIEYPLAYGELTGRANLELGARLNGVSRSRIASSVDRALSALDIVRYAPKRARALSLGNRQRFGIASALVHDPDLIVLDEPTNSLDPSGVVLVREALVRRAAAGAGILVSSHHLDEVARVATRITVVNAGRVVGTLDPHIDDIERAFFALVLADDESRTIVPVRA
ncbi:MAG: ABC transporter ATP-binding protein [Pseudolysinimonas sp.]